MSRLSAWPMHRSFTLLASLCLIAVAAGTCGRGGGRSDAGSGRQSVTGAGGSAGSGASNTGGGGGVVAGTGGTSEGGDCGAGGRGGVGIAGSGGTDPRDAGDGLPRDDANDGSPNAADALVDASDASREGGTQTPECLAKSTFEYHFILIGTGFDLYEGMNLVSVTADSSSNTCRASGTTQIQNGAFEIELVNLAASNYPSIDAFIDLDDNGKCSDAIDAKWHVSPAWSSMTPTRTMNLTPTNFAVSGNCAPSASW
jgi:hypothetical protein